MDTKINITELSVDEIVRKIKAFKADPNLIGLTLWVRRKETLKNSKIRQGQPHNVDNLVQSRKALKDNLCDSQEQKPTGKENRSTLNNFNTCGTASRKQVLISQYPKQHKDEESEQKTYQTETFEFIHDKRMFRAKKDYSQGNYDSAITLLDQLFEEAKTNTRKSSDYVQGDKERKIASITFLLGNCHYRKKSFQKAIEFYSYQIPEQNYKHKAMRKSNLGAIYLQLNKNQESLRNYTNALKIYSQCGCDDVDLSNTYHNVGNIYLREKMYEIASKYFQMSIEERKNKSPQAQVPLFYSAYKLGVSQKLEKKYQESLKTLLYAVSFAERGVGDLIQTFKQIAVNYELLGKQNEALTYYQKICDSGKSTEEDKGYAYERASYIYQKCNQYSQSDRIAKIAEQCYSRAGNEKKVSQIRQKNKQKSFQS